MVYLDRPTFVRNGIELYDADAFEDTNEECRICLSAKVLQGDGRVVRIDCCGHEFHFGCLMSWLESIDLTRDGTCPWAGCGEVLYRPSPMNGPLQKVISNLFEERGDLQERIRRYRRMLDQAFMSTRPLEKKRVDLLGKGDKPSKLDKVLTQRLQNVKNELKRWQEIQVGMQGLLEESYRRLGEVQTMFLEYSRSFPAK